MDSSKIAKSKTKPITSCQFSCRRGQPRKKNSFSSKNIGASNIGTRFNANIKQSIRKIWRRFQKRKFVESSIHHLGSSIFSSHQKSQHQISYPLVIKRTYLSGQDHRASHNPSRNIKTLATRWNAWDITQKISGWTKYGIAKWWNWILIRHTTRSLSLLAHQQKLSWKTTVNPL